MPNLPRINTGQFKKGIVKRDGVIEYPNAAIVKAQPAIVIKAEDEDSPAERTLTWVISSEAVDRDDDTIRLAGWDLKDFRKGGSVLWSHNPEELPIARPLRTWKDQETRQLKSRAEFTPRDLNPFGFMVHELAVAGFVRGASVGFKSVDFEPDEERGGFMPLNFLKQQLLEWSVTPVPSNPEALIDAQSKGIDLIPLKSWIEMIKDKDLRAVTPPDIDDGDLEVAYRCVAKATTYSIPSAPSGQKEKVTLMSVLEQQRKAVEELNAKANEMIDEATESLTKALAEIAELKAGRVISQANESKLRRASEMIAQVLEAVTPADANADESKGATDAENKEAEPEDFAEDADLELTEKEIEEITAEYAEQVEKHAAEAVARINGRVD